MTELDTESIWAIALDTTRFGKLNVRIGEILNFWVNEDASTDVTNTKVLPLLEQLSEEILIELIAIAKMNVTHDPWNFISANVVRVATDTIIKNLKILRKIAIMLGKKYNIKQTSTLTLPSHGD